VSVGVRITLHQKILAEVSDFRGQIGALLTDPHCIRGGQLGLMNKFMPED
jgi:hypothetical protein